MWSPTARQAGKCSPRCLWETREMFLQTDCCLCLALWCWLLSILLLNCTAYINDTFFFFFCISVFQKEPCLGWGPELCFQFPAQPFSRPLLGELGSLSISVLNLLISRIGEIVPAHGWCWVRLTRHNPWKSLITRSAGQEEAVVSGQTLPTWTGRLN